MRGRERGVSVGVDEPTTRLPVLEGRGLGAADPDLAAAAVRGLCAARAACRLAVRIVDAPARRELRPLPVPDVAGTCVVRAQSERGEGESQSSEDADADHFDVWGNESRPEYVDE